MNALRLIAAAALIAASRIASAQAFAPGEETVLQVRYLNLPTGEGRITVGEPAGEVWPVIFQAKTQGLAGFLDIREHLVSYWDATARHSRGYDLRAYEVGDFHIDSARFDRVNGTATYEKQRKGKRTVKKLEIPADVHDLTGALMWLRLQRLEPGHHHELPIVTGSRQFTLVADVLARETIDTPAGRFAALKVQVRTRARREVLHEARHVRVALGRPAPRPRPAVRGLRGGQRRRDAEELPPGHAGRGTLAGNSGTPSRVGAARDV